MRQDVELLEKVSDDFSRASKASDPPSFAVYCARAVNFLILRIGTVRYRPEDAGPATTQLPEVSEAFHHTPFAEALATMSPAEQTGEPAVADDEPPAPSIETTVPGIGLSPEYRQTAPAEWLEGTRLLWSVELQRLGLVSPEVAAACEDYVSCLPGVTRVSRTAHERLILNLLALHEETYGPGAEVHSFRLERLARKFSSCPEAGELNRNLSLFVEYAATFFEILKSPPPDAPAEA